MKTLHFQPPQGTSATGPATRSATSERVEDARPGYFDETSGHCSVVGLIGAAVAGAAIWAVLLSLTGVL